jgi:RNA polymerase primary sigma factor
MDIEYIYRKYLPFITSNYHALKYLCIPYDCYLEIVICAIKDMEDTLKGYNDLSKELINRINDYVLVSVKTQTNDSNYIYNVLNNFINSFMNDDDKKVTINKKFERLDDFLEKINYIPDPDLLVELLKNNKVFDDLVSKMFNKHRKDILEGRLYEVIEDDLISEIINAYLLKNKIEVKEVDTISDNDDIKLSNNDPLYYYRKEINAYPLLSFDEEKSLARRIKEGDLSARDQFINSNLRLVLSVVGKFHNTGVPYSDMVQDGNIGLIMAVDKFDPEKGFKFSTYATHWIRREILVGMMNKARTIRLPIHKIESMSKFRKAHRELAHDLLREPTIEEIAEKMNISIKEATNLLSLHNDVVSLNTKIGDEDELELQDVIADEEHMIDDEVIRAALSTDINRLFEKCNLTPKEIDILTMRFNLDGNGKHTLEETGLKYNISRERIRQIEAKALKRIRNSKYIKEFAVYMDNSDKALERLSRIRNDYIEDNVIIKEEKKPLKEEKKMVKEENRPKKEDKEMDVTDDNIFLKNLKELEKQNKKIPPKINKEEDSRKKPIKTKKEIPIVKMNPKNISKNVEKEEVPIKEEKKEKAPEVKLPPVVVAVPKEKEEPVEIDLEEMKTNEDNLSNHLIEAITELKNTSFGDLLKTMSVKEAVIVSLKFGFINDNYYTNESIRNYLNVEENEIREATIKMLLSYKKKVLSLVDDAILEVSVKKLNYNKTPKN